MSVTKTLLVAAGAALVSFAANAAEFKCAPPGTKFQFSNGNSATVVEQRGMDCIFDGKLANGQESRVTSRAFLATVSGNNNDWLNQVKPELVFPLADGKKHQAQYSGLGSNGWAGQWWMTYTVAGPQTVTVPAGTFNAYLIEAKEESAQLYRATSRTWYAPDLGWVVKFDYSNSSNFSRKWEMTSITKP